MIQFEYFTLDNGLRVFVHTDKTTPMAAVNVAYNVGSKDEDENRTGFAHLFEHLMFRGSKHIENYDKPLQSVGGENNAYTSSDLTNYHISLPVVNLETAFWLESDRMLGLDFKEEKLEAEKKVVIEEFKQNYLNQPYGDAWLKIHPLAYKVHPYRWATIGKDISHIEGATLQDVEDFFYKYYRPNNAVLVVAGDVEVEQVKALSQKWFGDIPRGEELVRSLPDEPLQDAPRHEDNISNVPMDLIYMVFHIPGRRDTTYYAADLLSDVLGRGRSARLHQRLVKEKNLCSSIRAYVTGSMEPGLLVIQAFANQDVDLKEIEKEIWGIIHELQSQMIEESELQKVKNKAESTIVFNEVELLSRSSRLAYYAIMGDASRINHESALIQAITPTQIRSMAQTVFTPKKTSTLYYLSK
jgi:predicted Zn-dependent peptidase